MKCLALVAVATLVMAAGEPVNRAELVKVHTVYLLPMANGLDQYLANWLTAFGIYRVTTDPARADAFFTDRVGAEFEGRVAELLPDTKKAPVEKAKQDADADSASNSPAAAVTGTTAAPAARSFGGGRGNIYLVGRESRLILWSTFGRPKDTRPKQMDGLAEKVILRLKRAMTEPQKP